MLYPRYTSEKIANLSMITLSKHIFISLLTAKNLSKNKGLKKFIEIFVIRFLYAFNFIRNLLNPKNNFEPNVSSKNFYEKNITCGDVLKDLNNYGYNNFLKLRKNYLDLIKNEISLKNSIITYKGNKNLQKFQSSLVTDSNLSHILEKSIENEISHVALDINLSETRYIRELATSDFLISLSRKYINAKKISISGQCYISNPINTSESEKKDNAQYYHYDNDFKKFFKVFIYLNNVDLQTGPHSFVSKTNTKKLFKHIIAKRIDDEEIKKCYDPKGIKIFCGDEGSIIIEDTFGLHKGVSPIKNSRMVLILIYGHGLGIDIYKNSLIKEYKN